MCLHFYISHIFLSYWEVPKLLRMAVQRRVFFSYDWLLASLCHLVRGLISVILIQNVSGIHQKCDCMSLLTAKDLRRRLLALRCYTKVWLSHAESNVAIGFTSGGIGGCCGNQTICIAELRHGFEWGCRYMLYVNQKRKTTWPKFNYLIIWKPNFKLAS